METVLLSGGSRPTGCFCGTIGFFDGVHLGHRCLIDQLLQAAADRGEGSMVITFERPPRQVVDPDWRPMLLTSLDEKKRLLSAAGVDVLALLRFDASMAALSARDFMCSVLREQLHCRTLLSGYDNRFGRGRAEGFEAYVGYGHELGIEVLRAEALMLDAEAVSSSRIRRLIGAGEMESAARCLGRRYELSGRVVHGEQIGRQLGFPTANIVADDPQKLVPADGVYAVDVTTSDGCHHAGMMNIGTRPTFDGEHRTLEVHLLDFAGDLYDQSLSVAFVSRLREELTFASADALRRQMNADAAVVRKLLFDKI